MTIKAHFDGKVFVPDEPVDLPAGEKVTVTAPTEPKKGKTGAQIAAALRDAHELHRIWEEIAAGRDSVEVARDLRRQASTRRPSE